MSPTADVVVVVGCCFFLSFLFSFFFFFFGGGGWGGLSKRAITRGFLARGGAGPLLYRLIQVCAHTTPKGVVFAPFRSENMFKFCPYIFV